MGLKKEQEPIAAKRFEYGLLLTSREKEMFRVNTSAMTLGHTEIIFVVSYLKIVL